MRLVREKQLTHKLRLPSEIPLEKWPSVSAFIEEAKACVKEAEKQGITLRVMEGAWHIHSHLHSRQRIPTTMGETRQIREKEIRRHRLRELR